MRRKRIPSLAAQRQAVVQGAFRPPARDELNGRQELVRGAFRPPDRAVADLVDIYLAPLRAEIVLLQTEIETLKRKMEARR